MFAVIHSPTARRNPMRRWITLHKRKRHSLPLLLTTGLALAALLLTLSALGIPSAEANETGVPALPLDPVRIGLGRSQGVAEVMAPYGLHVADPAGVYLQAAPGQVVKATLADGHVKVEGVERSFTSVRLVPVPRGLSNPSDPASDPINPIMYNGRIYRGEIEVLISSRDGRLSVINVVNMEEYLFGVVPREMFRTWPAEALKAQAVAARTYAAQSSGTAAQYKNEGFDMVDTPASQAYGGIRAEYRETSEAVLATKGEVLTLGGSPVVTYYHSSSGGHTENNEVIWTGGVPVSYLRGVTDYDNLPGNARYQWRYSYTPQQFAQELRTAGYDLGTILKVEPAGLIGASGRPSHWTITGTKGSPRTLTNQQLREALGTPSTIREVTVRPTAGEASLTRTYMPAEQVSVVAADGKAVTRPAQGSAIVGAGGTTATGGSRVVAAGPTTLQPAGVAVEGGGFGHAVGMSQWGAHGLAQQGKSYGEILTHYYQGTKVVQR